LKNPERWGRVFVFTFTTVVMFVLWLWLQWVRDTDRWELFAGFVVVLGIAIWKLWDYRP
jgi:hypothetical protein